MVTGRCGEVGDVANHDPNSKQPGDYNELKNNDQACLNHDEAQLQPIYCYYYYNNIILLEQQQAMFFFRRGIAKPR